MYNLTVAVAHTYFVGAGAWLVHNSCKSEAAQALRDLGLEGVDLAGKSLNSGQKALASAGFKLSEVTKTGRRVFSNSDSGAKVYYEAHVQ